MQHDLHDYMLQMSAAMQAEYTRIRRTARKDPGTAGDEGEENWADLLRNWLPPAYRVVTKGQLLAADGRLSPQLDIIVLKPSYPPFLASKKKYLAAGVAAVFECKLTLKPTHLTKIFTTCRAVKDMYAPDTGTPRKELFVGPIFGVLAHNHSWSAKQPKRVAVAAACASVKRADAEVIEHPRQMPDLLCVSNLATWTSEKAPLSDPKEELVPEARATLDPKGAPATYYMCHSGGNGTFSTDDPNFTPIGVALFLLLVKLAWDDRNLREIANYFAATDMTTGWEGDGRYWGRDIYTPELRRKLRLSSLSHYLDWNEWGAYIE